MSKTRLVEVFAEETAAIFLGRAVRRGQLLNRTAGRTREPLSNRYIAEPLEVRCLLSLFLPQQIFDTGNAPSAIALADLGNGHIDMVIPDRLDNNVSVFLGNGNSTFQTRQTFATGSNPDAVAVGDLGNGHPDLVVANNAANTVSVLLGNGNGTFQTQRTFATGASPFSIAIADLGNGHPDLVVANISDGTVSVLLGNGDGTFQAQQTYSTGIGPTSVAVADLGNGHPDIVVCNFHDATVSVLLGNGNGTFQTQQTFTVGNDPEAVAVADLGNGHPDLITANQNDDTVSVLLGNGSGTFPPPQTFAVGSAPDAVAVADLGNGHSDIVAANFNDGTVSVLVGNGSGTFQPSQTFATGASPVALAIADLGNGHPDLLVVNSADNNVSMLLGTGNTTVQQPDLALSGISYFASSYLPGDTLHISGTEQDLGSADAGSYSLDAVLSTDQTFGSANNIPLGTLFETGLSAGGSRPFSIQGTIPAGTTPGNYFLLVKIDSGNTVTESNESNNVFTSTAANVMVVRPPPPPPVETVGGLDPTFGSNGLVSQSVGFSSTADVAVQPDGKSVIAGIVGAFPSAQFGLTRLNPNGSLDNAFGNNGVVTTTLSGSDQPTMIALLPSGDILVAGTDTRIVNGQAAGSQFALAEYTAAGALDANFGNGTGKVFTSFSANAGALSNDVAHALIVGSNGTIYIGGSSDAFGTGLDFAIAAYNPDGTPLASFGSTGTAHFDFGGNDDSINALALQTNGDVVAAGSTTVRASSVASVALARFLLSGAIDPRFGRRGQQVVNAVRGVADVASSVAIDHLGRIVVGGLSATGSSSDGSLSSDFLVLRYTTSGVVDRTFGGGPVITSFNQPSAITKVLVQPDGSVVASGKTVSSLAGLVPNQLAVAIARYTVAGRLDTTFNGTGTAIINLGGGSATPAAAPAASPGAITAFDVQSLAMPLSFSPQDTAAGLLQDFAKFQQSAQGTVAITQGGELLDVGNSGGNTVEAAIILSGADLVAQLVATLPPAAAEGTMGLATVVVTAGGGQAATGAITIQLLASPDQSTNPAAVPLQSFPERINLRANQRQLFRLRYTLPSTDGDFYLVADVSSSSLHELNVSNNTAASTAAVEVAPPFVDLAGSSLAWQGTIVPGRVVSVGFNVANHGNVLAKATTVEFLASADGTVANGTVLATPALTLNLPPGVTRRFHGNFRMTITMTAGNYFLVALLDPSNTFNDPRLGDNLIVSQAQFTFA